jgi:peptidoglycan/xylan/chitin deacetylase (PgdA/CDA1 family)
MNVLSASVLIAVGWIAVAQAADCPRQGTLGTSRILAVDAATTPGVGLKSFPQTLPLGDHEVVLTFDDGPWPRTTARVLAALAHECVRATFFVIGKSASEHPDLVRKIAAEGHTIGSHT